MWVGPDQLIRSSLARLGRNQLNKTNPFMGWAKPDRPNHLGWAGTYPNHLQS